MLGKIKIFLHFFFNNIKLFVYLQRVSQGTQDILLKFSCRITTSQ